MEQQLRALAEPRRLGILELLRSGPMPAGAVAERFPDVTRPAVSQHLRILEAAGLVTETRQATRRVYALRSEGFRELNEYLSRFWDERLARLKDAAEQLEREESE